jgi:hypothetical protein
MKRTRIAMVALALMTAGLGACGDSKIPAIVQDAAPDSGGDASSDATKADGGGGDSTTDASLDHGPSDGSPADKGLDAGATLDAGDADGG